MVSIPIPTRVCLASALMVVLGAGCQSTNPFTLWRENVALKRSMSQLQGHYADLQRRTRTLDADNQNLQNLLAQEQQRNQQMESNLASSRVPYGALDTQQGPSGSPPDYRSTGWSPRPSPQIASTSPSFSSGVPVINIPGAEVSQEADVVRIRLTNEQLFDPGRATLKPGAAQTLRQVAAAIRQNYPGYLVGIEGHTDADPIRRSKWKHNHELSIARAMAVYDFLQHEGGLSSSQLFVAGYGPNVPIASNASVGGKAQNRRVELVIYPPHYAQR